MRLLLPALAAALVASAALAQEPATEATPARAAAERRGAPTVQGLLRLQVVFTEHDGTRLVSSLPYVLLVAANDTAVLGLRPAAMRTKLVLSDQVEMETNLDCRASRRADGRYDVEMTVERESLVPTEGTDVKVLPVDAHRLSLVRSIRASFTAVLRDGETSRDVTLTDPSNGHTLRVEVTLNVMK